jgi:hypothetical protein
VIKTGLPDVSIVVGDRPLTNGRWFWEVAVEQMGDEMWVGVTDDPMLPMLYHERVEVSGMICWCVCFVCFFQSEYQSGTPLTHPITGPPEHPTAPVDLELQRRRESPGLGMCGQKARAAA